MAERITRADLERLVIVLTNATGRPRHEWKRNAEGRSVATVGAFVLDYAACYGGYHLVEIISDNGGEDPVNRERMNARHLSIFIRGMIEAAELIAKRAAIEPCPTCGYIHAGRGCYTPGELDRMTEQA